MANHRELPGDLQGTLVKPARGGSLSGSLSVFIPGTEEGSDGPNTSAVPASHPPVEGEG